MANSMTKSQLTILCHLQKESLSFQIFSNTTKTHVHVVDFLNSSLTEMIESHFYQIQEEFISKCCNISFKQVPIVPPLDQILVWFKDSLHQLANDTFQVFFFIFKN